MTNNTKKTSKYFAYLPVAHMIIGCESALFSNTMAYHEPV